MERVLRSSPAAKRLRDEENARKEQEQQKRLKLTVIRFPGKIKYCTTFIDCAVVCEDLLTSAKSSRGEFVVGFDVEWPFSFQTGSGKTSLLQLCPSEEVCYLLHVSKLRTLPKALAEFLAHPNVRLAGVNVRNDVRKLSRDFKGINGDEIVKNCVDSGSNQANVLTDYSRRWSMAALLEEFLYMEINKDKKVRMSQWDVIPLSKDQINYAATDAYASLKLYDFFKEMEKTQQTDTKETDL